MSSTRVPTVGLFRDDRHRYYIDGTGPFPGVTSVIRALDKPAIIEWAKRETARCAVDNYDFVADLIKRGGPKAASDWLARIPDYTRDTAADMGSAVHALAEKESRAKAAGFHGISDEGITPDQLPFVRAFRNFLEDHQPKFLSLERMVFSEKWGYGGTFDWIAQLLLRKRIVNILGDTKTGKNVYMENALQLAALSNADFCGLPGDPKRYRIPKIEAHAILHIRPDQYARGYRLIEYRVGPDDFAAFLACLTLTNWRVNAQPIGESIPLPDPTAGLPREEIAVA